MWHIFKIEINAFFSSLIGYIVIGVFLILMGLALFIFPATSLLESGYASLFPFFSNAPWFFLLLIPAVTMRVFAEENQSGTIEFLLTKPLTEWQIIGGKFLACWVLVLFALIPTVLYYITIHQLGSPPGNLDSGAILGSYFGLAFLGAVFTAIGIFTSSMANNQIVAFILGAFFCFFMYIGFDYISELPVFFFMDDIIQSIGINAHYQSISQGVVDSRDMIYFSTVIIAFLSLTKFVLSRRNW